MLKLLNEIRYLLNRREKILCLGIIIMMVIGALLEIMGIGLIMPVIALLTNPKLIEQNKYLNVLHSIIKPDSNEQFIILMCVILIVLYILKNVFLLSLTYFQSKFIYDKSTDLGCRLYKSYLRAPFSFHLQHNSAELLNNINLIEQVSAGVLLPFMMLITESVVIVMIFALLLFFSPVATIILALVSIIVSLMLYYPQKNYSYRLGEKLRYHLGKIFQFVMQGLEGIKETKIRNCEEWFLKSYSEHQTKRNNAAMMHYTIGQLPRFFIEAFVVAMGMLTLMMFVLTGIATGSIILKLSLFAVAMFRLMPSMSRVQYNLTMIRHSLCSFDRIYHDITALASEEKQNTDEQVSFSKSINIADITFSYDGGKNIIQDFSFEISQKESVAIVGPTGCGKTTLVDIILGILKPDKGQILVDGKNIEKNLASWQTQIGYVPQVIYLLDSSIRSNVAFGIPEDQIDDVQVMKCLKTAQIFEFANTLPEKLNTFIGERGIRLSGGQRQRLGIARALYNNPELLVLDEATSALDSETEKAFVDALKALHGKLTIIMIAHRLTTVEHCDKTINL